MCRNRYRRGIVMSGCIDEHPINTVVSSIFEHVAERLWKSLKYFRMFGFSAIGPIFESTLWIEFNDKGALIVLFSTHR